MKQITSIIVASLLISISVFQATASPSGEYTSPLRPKRCDPESATCVNGKEVNAAVPVAAPVAQHAPAVPSGVSCPPFCDDDVEHYAALGGLKGIKSSSPKSSGVKGGQQQQVKGYSPVSAMVSQSNQPQVVAYSVPVGSQPLAYNAMYNFPRYHREQPKVNVEQPSSASSVAFYAPSVGLEFPRYHREQPKVNVEQPSSDSSVAFYAPSVGLEFPRYHREQPKVNGEQPSYYASVPLYAPSVGQAVYKQQAVQYQSPLSYQPFAFYGYPVNQASPSMVQVQAPVAPVVVPAPVVPASPVQAGRAQAAPSSPLYAAQEQLSQQTVEQIVEKQTEQVVEKQAEKSPVKGH